MEQQRIHKFQEQLDIEKINRKPLNHLYSLMGNGWIPEERIDKQKQGIDGYSVINNKMVSFEEKIHTTDYNFRDELFLELEHYNLHGIFKGYGWSLKNIQAKCFVEFCVETQQFFAYKTEPLFKQVKEYYNNKWPNGSHYPSKVLNEGMETTIIKVPRHYFKEHLMFFGYIKNGVVSINENK